MTKFKIILGIIAIIILSSVATLMLSQKRDKPVSRAAVKVVLNQTPDYRLSLKALTVESSYSSDYKLTVPFGHYNVKIIADKDTALFSGRVGKNKVIFPPDVFGQESE